MSVAVLSAHRRFHIEENPVGPPGPGEIQVRVEAAGICGSDVHYFSEGHIGDTPCVYPMVLGHEPAGSVLSVGEGVTGWSPGDRVAIENQFFCYHCERCMTGRHNLCDRAQIMGSPEVPGIFRDRLNIGAINLLPLPPNLSFAQATLYEPVSIILHSMRFAQVGVGETVAVFGAGPIGLTTIAAVKLAGASRIWAVEPLPHRHALARHTGADAVLNPRQGDPVKEILKETGGKGVDLAIDCATRDDTINQCLNVTRAAGRVVVTGVPAEQRYPLEFHTLRKKELGFFTVRRSNHNGPAALKLLSERLSLFAPIITHHRPLDAIQQAFEMIEVYDDQVGKVVICPAP